MAQPFLWSLMAFCLSMMSHTIASPLSSTHVNPPGHLLSDHIDTAKLTKRSFPFPKERCDSYFGSLHITDCIGAVAKMWDRIPPTARDSYQTFTNDIHLPAMASITTFHQLSPLAWYGPLGRFPLPKSSIIVTASLLIGLESS